MPSTSLGEVRKHSRRTVMLRKLTAVLAVAAFGITAAMSVPAEAQHHNKNVTVNRNVNVNRTVNVNRNVRVNRNVTVNA